MRVFPGTAADPVAARAEAAAETRASAGPGVVSLSPAVPSDAVPGVPLPEPPPIAGMGKRPPCRPAVVADRPGSPAASRAAPNASPKPGAPNYDVPASDIRNSDVPENARADCEETDVSGGIVFLTYPAAKG